MRAWMLVWVVVAGGAWAGKKTVVVGAGDCKDGVLLASLKEFQDAARLQLKGDALEPDAVLRAVKPQATRSIDDIARQIDTARSLLYGGQNERGLELAQDALAELERASPQVKPWPLTVSALVLQAQMLKNLERFKDSNDAFRRILRIEPTFKLDPDGYPPSTLQALETVRKEVQRSKKGALQIASTPGALAFVDGRELGKVPLKVELPQGVYRVALTSGEGVSFPRKVTLGREELLQVDLAFEGAVAQQLPLCVSGETDSAALKLASSVAAEQVVVLRNSAPRGNPPYVTGTLFDVGRGERVRNAGVHPAQLRDLMLYLFTGKPDIVADERKPPEVAATVPREVPPPPRAVEPAAVTVEPTAHVSGARVAGFVLLGVGAALAVTGVVLAAAGTSADRASLSLLNDGSGHYSDTAAAELLLRNIAGTNTVAFTLLGVGAGSALAGVLAIALFPGSATTVAVLPASSGGLLTVRGSF